MIICIIRGCFHLTFTAILQYYLRTVYESIGRHLPCGLNAVGIIELHIRIFVISQSVAHNTHTHTHTHTCRLYIIIGSVSNCRCRGYDADGRPYVCDPGRQQVRHPILVDKYRDHIDVTRVNITKGGRRLTETRTNTIKTRINRHERY